MFTGDKCTKDGAKCENLRNCSLIKEVQTGGIRPPICGFKDKEVIVCCSSDLINKFGEINFSISKHSKFWI